MRSSEIQEKSNPQNPNLRVRALWKFRKDEQESWKEEEEENQKKWESDRGKEEEEKWSEKGEQRGRSKWQRGYAQNLTRMSAQTFFSCLSLIDHFYSFSSLVSGPVKNKTRGHRTRWMRVGRLKLEKAWVIHYIGQGYEAKLK